MIEKYLYDVENKNQKELKMELVRINGVNWKPIQHKFYGKASVNPNQVCVSYHYKLKNAYKNEVDFLCVRLGSLVAKELNWKQKDKIQTLYDPDNLSNFLCLKSQNKVGRAIIELKNEFIFYFNWHHLFSLKPREPQLVKFIVFAGQLNFCLPIEDENDNKRI